jgi:hypothetical protein
MLPPVFQNDREELKNRQDKNLTLAKNFTNIKHLLGSSGRGEKSGAGLTVSEES